MITIVFVIMGVSGCGKTTVGLALAEKLDAPFYDEDDFHPPENVAKMARGVPLDDEDRFPFSYSQGSSGGHSQSLIMISCRELFAKVLPAIFNMLSSGKSLVPKFQT